MAKCVYCKNEFEKVNKVHKYCSNQCSRKYHSSHNIRHRRAVSLSYWRKHNTNNLPMWKCDEGHEIQLDFHPRRFPERMKSIICPICNKKAT